CGRIFRLRRLGVRGHRRLHGEEPRCRIPARRSSLTTGPLGPPPSPRLLPAPPHHQGHRWEGGFNPPTRPHLTAGGAAEGAAPTVVGLAARREGRATCGIWRRSALRRAAGGEVEAKPAAGEKLPQA